MEELLKQIPARLDEIESNVERTAGEVVRMHLRTSNIESRVLFLEGIERKLDHVVQKFENMDRDNAARFRRIEKTVAAHEVRLGKSKKSKKDR